jgi:hypothetical protein
VNGLAGRFANLIGNTAWAATILGSDTHTIVG